MMTKYGLLFIIFLGLGNQLTATREPPELFHTLFLPRPLPLVLSVYAGLPRLLGYDD